MVEERKIAAAAVLFLHTGGEGGGGEEEGRVRGVLPVLVSVRVCAETMREFELKG